MQSRDRKGDRQQGGSAGAYFFTRGSWHRQLPQYHDQRTPEGLEDAPPDHFRLSFSESTSNQASPCEARSSHSRSTSPWLPGATLKSKAMGVQGESPVSPCAPGF